MIIEYSNLDNGRKIFLNRELADILYLCRKKKISVPELDINIISLSSPAEIPDRLKEKIKIAMPTQMKDFKSFDQLCEWENSIQVSQIFCDGNKIWIIGGGPEGALYGFYETVKEITGVRWYGTAETDVFFAEQSGNIEKIHRPLVPFRGFEFSPKNENKDFALKFLKWMVRNGWNLLDINAAHWENFVQKQEFIKLCNIYGIRLAIGCHAIDFFVPESFLSKNPEFMGFRNGKRCLSNRTGSPDIAKKWMSKIQPCYSNQNLRKFLIQSIRDFVEKHPETYIFSLWPLDGINNWCQCDRCRQKTPYEIFYQLSIELSAAIGKFLPVELLCYSNMLHLPEKMLPFSSNTYTIFCPYLRHYKHRFYDPGFEESTLTLGKGYPEPEPINPADDREYGILISRWLPYLEKCGSRPGLFSYYQLVFHDETEKNDRQRYLYHPDPQLVEEEINKFIQYGIRVFYDCSPPYPGFWPDGRFYTYLSRLFWENKKPVEKIIREFYRAIAGERAEVLQNIMKNISYRLNEEKELPQDVIKTAQSIFNLLQVPLNERYLLWLEYISMGKKTWIALRQNQIARAIENEKQIIDFFKRNRKSLEDCLNVDWMIKHSESIIKFYSKNNDE